MANDKRKQSLYFSTEDLAEIQQTAVHLDRSVSWIIQQAWKIAREKIKSFPSVEADGVKTSNQVIPAVDPY